MAYRFENGEMLSVAVERIFLEEVEAALDNLENYKADPETAVHNVRLATKKVRALLRLIADEIGEKRYGRETRRLREVARGLSVRRDEHALSVAIGLVGEKAGESLSSTTITEMRALFDVSSEHDSGGEEPADVTRARELLHESKISLQTLPIERQDFRALKHGLRKEFFLGRRAYHKVYEDESIRNYHQWRRHVKYLMYQLQLLRPLWNDEIKHQTHQLRDLAKYLGQDHDLAMLAKAFSDSELIADSSQRQLILLSIDILRADFQGAAKAIGARFFAEKARSFAKKYECYWDIWQREWREVAETLD